MEALISGLFRISGGTWLSARAVFLGWATILRISKRIDLVVESKYLV